MRTLIAPSVALAALLVGVSAHADTLSVGPGKTYATPCAAIAAAKAGDTIEVAASGSYDGDHCSWSTDNLTVRGVGGRAKIDAGKDPANVYGGKGIFHIAAPNATVENFELAGATVPDQNGAGIRHQGTNLTVRGCYFHDNDDGILGAPPTEGTGEVLIENSEFDKNGYGDGQSHNIYINHYAKFTLRGSYSHGAKVGHLVKTRALENHILYNRLTGEPGTTASYELTFPSAGLSFVIGNMIEQPDTSENSAIIDYGSEKGDLNPDQRLFVINNTVINNRGAGIFVQNGLAEPAVLTNNIFAGPGTISSQAGAILTSNYTADPELVAAGAYDFHLLAGSPCVDAGSDPGDGAGQALIPRYEYVHPLSLKLRVSVGAIDIGAYEFGNPGAGGGGSGGAGGGGTGGGAAGTGGGSTGSATGSGGGLPGRGGAGNDASSGGGDEVAGDDAGCGCRVAPASTETAPFAALSLLGLALAWRRRRGSGRD